VCLFSVAVAVIASHILLPFSRFSWRSKVLLSASAAIIAAGVMLGFGPLRRPLNLYHANLSGQWLLGDDLRKADLSSAKLAEANLTSADLRDAYLDSANLNGDADLSGTKNLTQTQLNEACGNANTKLPEGLTLKPCSTG
jgi:hypothetical protein